MTVVTMTDLYLQTAWLSVKKAHIFDDEEHFVGDKGLQGSGLVISAFKINEKLVYKYRGMFNPDIRKQCIIN